MRCRRLAAAALATVIWCSAPAFAQSTRTEQIDETKAAKAASLQPETRDKGDVIVESVENLFTPGPGLKLSFGDFRAGGGFGPGVAAGVPVGAHGLWTTKAAWSTRNFKLVESGLELSGLAGGHLDVRPFARWEDAPSLDLFGVGSAATATTAPASYALTSSEAGVDTRVRLTRWIKSGGEVEFVDDRSDVGATTTLASAATRWVHSQAYAAFDTRESESYADHGSLCSVTFHDYANPAGRNSFTRTEIDLRQYIPVAHENWIVALQARANLTDTAADQVIPYFMLPYVGGGSSLRGYPEYRFTDRDSLLFRSELRWAAASVLDMAFFIDKGQVAPAVRSFGLHDFKSGWGIGARIHGPTFTALRLDVARGDEGWQLHIGRNIGF